MEVNRKQCALYQCPSCIVTYYLL